MSNDGDMEKLTERQLQLLALLDQGAPLKVAAAELGISQARVNQIVRDLKDRLGAQSKFDLVQIYRLHSGVRLTYRKDRYPESGVGLNTSEPNYQDGTTAGEFVFSDVQGFNREAPWQGQIADPPVVPEMLDGPHANVRRLIAMLLLVMLIVMAITFAGVTTLTVTDFWSRFGSISTETRSPAK